MVQQLVKQNVGNEVPWHPTLVEHGMDAHESFGSTVSSEFDCGPRFPAWRCLASPGDLNIATKGSPEVALIDPIEQSPEVVNLPHRMKRLGHWPFGADSEAVGLDVLTDNLGSVPIATDDIPNQGLFDPLRGVQEHHVQSHLKRSPRAGLRDHAPSVIGDGELHGTGTRQLEPTLEHLPRPFVNEDLWTRSWKIEWHLVE